MTVKISRQARAGLIDGFLRAFGVQACLRRCKAVVCLPVTVRGMHDTGQAGNPGAELSQIFNWGNARRQRSSALYHRFQVWTFRKGLPMTEHLLMFADRRGISILARGQIAIFAPVQAADLALWTASTCTLNGG